MKYSRILITGSKGVIGRILTGALSDSFTVYGLDIEGEEDQRNHRVDISRYEELDDVFKRIGGIEAIIHLASDSRVEADWESILKKNIIGTRNIYECAREYGVRKVIFASSNHVTGAYEGIPPALHKLENPQKIMVQARFLAKQSPGNTSNFMALGQFV
jgi:nucleoside-diphosphate-sugar epimerase